MKLQEDFVPHPWVWGGQLQTIFGFILGQNQTRPTQRREVLPLNDGDAIALDINEPDSKLLRSEDRPIVLMLHGLGGCSESAYLLRISAKLNRTGLMTVRMNHRGCGREPVSAKKIYHSGSVDDLLAVLDFLAERYPNRPVLVTAFSLSATITLNALGQRPDECRKRSHWRHSIVVCPPLDLERSSRKIARISNRHIDYYYTRTLIEHCRSRHPEIYRRRMQGANLWRWNLRAFDQWVTAPEGGFLDRSDYYKQCSPLAFLAKIQKPTTLLAALDDPVVCTAALQQWSQVNSELEVVVTSSGGHMGFISKYPTLWHDRFWMDHFIVTRILNFFDLPIQGN